MLDADAQRLVLFDTAEMNITTWSILVRNGLAFVVMCSVALDGRNFVHAAISPSSLARSIN